MANRDMTNQSFSFEKHRKVVSGRVSFGATGAPTLDGVNSKGIIAVTRNSVGNFTFQFGVSVNGLSYIDGYIKLLALEWQPDISYVQASSPAAVGQPAIYRIDLLSGMNLTPPVQAAIVGSTTGGTVPAGTNYYVVTAIDSTGNESLVSNEQNVTNTGGTSSNTISWAIVPGAVGYRIYRGTAAGAENTVYLVTAGNIVTFIDTGAATQASAAQPVIPARPPVAKGSITIQSLNGSGAATDPATGEAVYAQFDLGDSGAP